MKRQKIVTILGTRPEVIKMAPVIRELIEASAGKIVGTDSDTIVEAATRLLTDSVEYARMTAAENPFGDGHAAERVVNVLAQSFDAIHS